MLTENLLSDRSVSNATVYVPPLPAGMLRVPQTFRHTIEIFLKDSNAYTNTYFSRYFEWQGICRERWFFTSIQADMLQNEGVFITKRAHQSSNARSICCFASL
jgi:hypothetical protein